MSDIHACTVCGKPIAASESRIVDKNRTTKAELHTHLKCKGMGQQSAASPGRKNENPRA